MLQHQYIERATGRVVDERLLGDGLVNLLYSSVRERAPALFRALTGARASDMLARVSFDSLLSTRFGGGAARFARRHGIDLAECLDEPAALDTPRQLFERRIRYWECRPMTDEPGSVVAPADSRLLVGSLARHSRLYVKEKFFTFEELLGELKTEWLAAFAGGDFAIHRLTPDKYHYNHTPVAGTVVDCYEIPGGYHSCNPGAVVQAAGAISTNKRAVTVFDTDRPGGTGIGLVAMIEVVALMIGGILQAYSERFYDDPQPVEPGLRVEKGQPKSLFRPGSSTVVLLFQAGRVEFAPDLLANQVRPGVRTRFSLDLVRPLVETDVPVRSTIASARADAGPGGPEAGREERP